jgi:CheY-like chemotaxis protein
LCFVAVRLASRSDGIDACVGTPRAPDPRDNVRAAVTTSERSTTPGTLPAGTAVWIVEDEPAAAALAADLCALNGTRAEIYRDGQLFLDALRSHDPRPSVLVLDWRLERGLSAPLFMAARHRAPSLPVVFWTGSAANALPQMIHADPRACIVDKAQGTEAFEHALRWALDLAGIPRPAG